MVQSISTTEHNITIPQNPFTEDSYPERLSNIHFEILEVHVDGTENGATVHRKTVFLSTSKNLLNSRNFVLTDTRTCISSIKTKHFLIVEDFFLLKVYF